MIPNKLYRRLTMIMAFLVLFGNIGVGMVEHQCMMKGKSVNLTGYHFFQEEQATCSMEHKSSEISYDAPAFHKKACCSDHNKYGKVEVVSSSQISFLKVLKAFTPFIIPESLLSWVPVFKIQLQEVLLKPLIADISPRLFGRSLLVHVQTFLI